jgi:hypothetical protein
LRRTALRPTRSRDEEQIVDEGTAEARHSVAMRLLYAGVPLSLLIDLLPPDGPDSLGILAMERPDPAPVGVS